MAEHVRRRRGTTLIDAITAVVILSLGLPPLVMAFVEVATGSVRPLIASAACMLARERMEEVIARRSQSGGYAQVIAANFPDETPVNGFARYSRTVTTTDVSPADLTTPQAGSGLRSCTVTVTWDGGQRQVTATRLFADY